MAELRELSYRDLTRRLRKLGFRFYRHGKPLVCRVVELDGNSRGPSA
jgi:hypothetical protein